MSTRLSERLAACQTAGRTPFVATVPVGYPTKDSTAPVLLELEKQGADVIQLLMPLEDSGDAIMDTAIRASYYNGFQYDDIFSAVREARQKGLGLPVVLKCTADFCNVPGHICACEESGLSGLYIARSDLDDVQTAIEAGGASELTLTLVCEDDVGVAPGEQFNRTLMQELQSGGIIAMGRAVRAMTGGPLVRPPPVWRERPMGAARQTVAAEPFWSVEQGSPCRGALSDIEPADSSDGS